MRQLLTLIGALVLCCACAVAGPVLTIDIPDVTAPHGGTAFWNFHLYNDVDYLVVAEGSFENLGSVGTFFDVISALPFHPVAPGETWSGVFGRYTVDSGAVPPAAATGKMTIKYDLYDGAFNNISYGNFLDSVQTASITVSAVPEPAGAVLLLTGLSGLLLFRRRNRSR